MGPLFSAFDLLSLLLVVFHCSAGAHMRSALFGAQNEVDTQRENGESMWHSPKTPHLQTRKAYTLKVGVRVLRPVIKWIHYPHSIFSWKEDFSHVRSLTSWTSWFKYFKQVVTSLRFTLDVLLTFCLLFCVLI